MLIYSFGEGLDVEVRYTLAYRLSHFRVDINLLSSPL